MGQKNRTAIVTSFGQASSPAFFSATMVTAGMATAAITTAWLLFFGCAAPVMAQGMFLHDPIDRPSIKPPGQERRIRWRPDFSLKNISVDANIRDQIAKTQVSQTFKNTSNRTLETTFVFPLPADAAIENFTLIVDGKELTGKLMAADKAKSIYQGYVRKFEDPALLEWVGQGMFKSSVFPVPAGSERQVIFTYSQLLKKENQLIDYQFPLSTAKYSHGPVGKVDVTVAIESTEAIKSVYSPTYDAEVKRTDENHALVTYEKENTIPQSNFKLYFDTVNGKVGASVLSWWPKGEENGYFMLLASPTVKPDDTATIEKTILFVVDHSGSMNGKKMMQAREAAKFVVNNLSENDTFNIFRYSNSVENFRPELERYSPATRGSAVSFINDTFAGGGTNINDALQTAVGSLSSLDRPTYVVFLTDGKPTSGVTDEMEIVKNFNLANSVNARVISFGVGHDVNSRLIDRLTNASNGQSVYVSPDEDIETAVSRLYAKIAAPILTGIEIDYGLKKENDDTAVNRVYPSKPVDLFAKSQIVIVGRYNQSGATTIELNGRVGKTEREFKFPATFARRGEGQDHRFIEKLWASRRIGEIIDQLDLNGQNDELVQELVTLSVRHGIMTPYTSFLADENQDKSVAIEGQSNIDITRKNTLQLKQQDGAFGFQQRAEKQAYSRKLVFNMESSAEALSKMPSMMPPKAVGGAFNKDNTGGAAVAGTGPAGGGFGGNLGGGGFAASPAATTPEENAATRTSGIRNQKSATVYKRGDLLFAANAADVEVEKATFVDVVRFSDEYFDLVNDNDAEINEAFSLQRSGEDLIIRIKEKLYRIKG